MENYNTKVYNPSQKANSEKIEEIVNFLYEHLQEYGDSKTAIRNAIQYAFGEDNAPGGFVLTLLQEDKIVGSVVVNRTGMKEYIPENILVYISVHDGYRGRGLGKALMRRTIEAAEGNIALHVEPDNPAKYLYEHFGFTNKYLEMRLDRDKDKAGRASLATQQSSQPDQSQ